MKIGFSELILVFIVALIVIGPDKLPGYAKKLGEALATFRKASDEATREIKENITEPLEEAARPLREAMEPVEELDRAVRGNMREVENSLRQVGKKKPVRKDTETVQPPESDENQEAPEKAEITEPESEKPAEENESGPVEPAEEGEYVI